MTQKGYGNIGYIAWADTNEAFVIEPGAVVHATNRLQSALFAGTTGTNYGTIESPTRTGSNSAAMSSALNTQSGSTFTNAGTIVAAQAYSGSYTGAVNAITNSGSLTLTNSGAIRSQTGTGVALTYGAGDADVVSITNTGVIDGYLNGIASYSGGYGTGSQLYADYGPQHVVNQAGGQITGHERAGVALNSTAGVLDNAGTIDGPSGSLKYAVNMAGTSTVNNSGTINGPVHFLYLVSSADFDPNNSVFAGPGYGTLNNLAGGVINGSITVDLSSTGLHVSNAGLINGNVEVLGYRAFHGTVANMAGGRITGDVYGTGDLDNAGTLGNARATGAVVNTGTIGLKNGSPTGTGVVLQSNQTLTNAGLIEGTAQAVQLYGGDRVVLDPGSVLQGGIGGQLSSSTLELATGATAGAVGTITNFGGGYSSFGSIVVDPGADWAITGAGAVSETGIQLGQGATLTNGTSGYTQFGPISGSGTVVEDGAGTLNILPSSGWTGTATIAAGTLELGTTGIGAVTFAAAAGERAVLALANAPNGMFTPTLDGFDSARDTLDLMGLHYTPGSTATYDSGAHLLTVKVGQSMSTFGLSGGQVGPLTVVSDGVNGVLVEGVACFCTGTAILTEEGERAVETIRPGERVVTADGRLEAVVWVGRRSYTGRFLRRNPASLPVRIRAGALGGGLPRRDLRVSANHAMALDGVLVPASALVDGAAIVLERDCARVDYVHLELAQHEVILAEGAASETFLDDDSRGLFSHQEGVPGEARGFALPRVEQGYELEAIRNRLRDAA